MTQPVVTCTVNINKIDAGGDEVPGATLQLTGVDEDGNPIIFEKGCIDLAEDAELINGVGEKLVWKSGTDTTIVTVEDGTYTLHEEAAPNGYLKATDITFVVKDGKVVIDGEEVASVDMTDERIPVETSTTTTTTTVESSETSTTTAFKGTVAPDDASRTTTKRPGGIGGDDDTRTKTTASTETTTVPTTTVRADVKICKQDIYHTEVAGATLTLTGEDVDGNPIIFEFSDLDFGANADFVGEGEELTWISGTTPTYVKNLPDGNYVLHEVAAPDGFEVATDITFTIQDAKVIGTTDNTITMIDTRVGEAEISKKNVYGDEIKGATLTLTGTDAEGNPIIIKVDNVILGEEAILNTKEDGPVIEWVSGTSPTVIKNLPDGTYVLKEIAAPRGYEVTTEITFTVEDGKLTGSYDEVTGVGVTGNSVVLKDDMIVTEVSISKKSVFGKEIVGATLTLTGEDITGRTVIFELEDVVLGKDAKLISTDDTPVLQWISGEQETIIKNLPDGIYELEETNAPIGYTIATKITFEIVNGVVTGDVQVVKDNNVTMEDDLAVTTVEISKQNVFDKEIPGATLQLTGTNLEEVPVTFNVDSVDLGEGAKGLTTKDEGKVLEWVSGSTPTVVKDLPDGTYVLKEVAAPHGYEVATEITFVIKGGVVVDEETGVTSTSVTMIDDMTKTDVEISKQNIYSKEVPGATLTLTGTTPDGKVTFDVSDVKLGEGAEGLKVSEDGTTLEWVSGKTPTTVKLPDGTYVLHEVAAPSGYVTTTDITFTIEDGKLVGNTTATSNSVTMIDDQEKNDITISKQDVFSKEIAGATLTLTGTTVDGDKVVFDITKDVILGDEAENLTSSTDGTVIQWVSGKTPTTVKVPDGTYVLHEVAAPSGYEVASDITFTVSGGKIVDEDTVFTSTSVTMIDDMKVTTTTSTTTTTTTSTSTTGKTTTKTTKTTSAKTTTKKTSAPKTGVAGVGMPLAAIAVAATAAFATRKKRDDE